MPQNNNKDRIQTLIDNSSALELELVFIPRIMENQTTNEKALKQSIETNGIGLNKFDSKVITGMYKHIRNGSHLSEDQAIKARHVLRKYWRQYKEKQKCKEPVQTQLF